jgi:hypothetical protein
MKSYRHTDDLLKCDRMDIRNFRSQALLWESEFGLVPEQFDFQETMLKLQH